MLRKSGSGSIANVQGLVFSSNRMIFFDVFWKFSKFIFFSIFPSNRRIYSIFCMDFTSFCEIQKFSIFSVKSNDLFNIHNIANWRFFFMITVLDWMAKSLLKKDWKEFTSPRKSCKKPDRISFKLAKKYRSSKTIFIIFEKKNIPYFSREIKVVNS